MVTPSSSAPPQDEGGAGEEDEEEEEEREYSRLEAVHEGEEEGEEGDEGEEGEEGEEVGNDENNVDENSDDDKTKDGAPSPPPPKLGGARRRYATFKDAGEKVQDDVKDAEAHASFIARREHFGRTKKNAPRKTKSTIARGAVRLMFNGCAGSFTAWWGGGKTNSSEPRA